MIKVFVKRRMSFLLCMQEGPKYTNSIKIHILIPASITCKSVNPESVSHWRAGRMEV